MTEHFDGVKPDGVNKKNR